MGESFRRPRYSRSATVDGSMPTEEQVLELPPADPMLYDADLALAFPYDCGPLDVFGFGSREDDFLSLFLGWSRDTAGHAYSDPFRRVLRTRRCYLGPDGTELVAPDDDDDAQAHAMRELLLNEYREAVDEPALAAKSAMRKFRVIVAKTVARRLQLTCGLTTQMFMNADKTKIVLTIRADDHDLRVEAARVGYQLQVSNRPFDATLHEDKLTTLRRELSPREFAASKEHLRRSRPQQPLSVLSAPDATSSENATLLWSGSDRNLMRRGSSYGATMTLPVPAPEMDPLLRAGEHPRLGCALERLHHNEDADGVVVREESETPARRSLWRQLWDSLVMMTPDPAIYFAPYAEYKLEALYQPYYRRYPLRWGDNKEETMFAQKDRIRLASSIVRRHINIDVLVEQGFLDGDMFAVHDEDALEDLRVTWATNWTMFDQPLHKLRFYFGEKIALYFAWLGCFTKMLLLPSVATIVFWLWHGIVWLFNRDDVVRDRKWKLSLVAHSFFMVLWASFFISLWNRKNSLLNGLWGLHGYLRDTHHRAEFRGRRSHNIVTDAPEMTFADPPKRRRAFLRSIAVVITMIGAVLAITGVLMWLRYRITHRTHYKIDGAVTWHSRALLWGVSVVNALQIIVCNTIYTKVARKLNDLENHRTDRAYENFLILKVFAFEFVNSYATLFYIVFLKDACEGPSEDAFFLGELTSQLLILFISRIIVGNAQEVLKPLLYSWARKPTERWTRCWAQLQSERNRSVERQTNLVPYEQAASFEDYSEMMILFGYVVLFGVVSPMVTLLALCNNFLEVHVDAIKICNFHRRPFPHPAKSIGAWSRILRFLIFVSFAMNAGLLIWKEGLLEALMTAENINVAPEELFDPSTKVIAFMLYASLSLLAYMVVQQLVPTVPRSLELLMQRHEFIVGRVFKGLGDQEHYKLREEAEELDLQIEGFE
ncbi:TPA: hypothetical protein N0F65_000791 [Lagenidium giganteum]|uniref:Anoctamin transmembrane domain-containing protein n=1 Tax=Lagenidium giganteum TaxID=4803 RepID=A0AAV2ZL95_9STRA|nr:TPA: hypothetical protein N0F65_000791 [Lagenidium giganteum]